MAGGTGLTTADAWSRNDPGRWAGGRAEAKLRRLAYRAGKRFRWKWQPTEIAGQRRSLAVAADPDRMLIDACKRQDAGDRGVVDPFWATTWRAAAGLDCYLQRMDLHQTRILELGCGTGHAGIAAALMGARVLLTDGVTDPLLLVRLSSWSLRDRCRIRRFRFGVDQLDEPPFPLILGSDVTYLRELWPQLDRSLRGHLAEGGEALLSDPYRIIANEFRDWIGQRGWQYHEHRIALSDDADHPIRVMQLMRK